MRVDSSTKWLVLATLIVQLALVSISFPVGQLLTGVPLLHTDAGYHWYQIVLAKDLARTGAIVGYDPTFNAGYPGGVTYNWSAKAPAALAVLLGDHIDPAVAYKLHSFVSAVLGPACVALALRWFGLGLGVCAVGTLFGFLLWWASMFHWFHTAGMVSFVAGSYAALPYAAAVLRHLDGRGGWGRTLTLGIIGAFLMFYHFMFGVPVAAILIGAVLGGARVKSPGRAAAVFLGIPAICLAANLWWLLPARHYWTAFSPGVADPFPHQKVVDASILWKELLGLWSGTAHGSKIYYAIALCAVVACLLPARAEDRRTARGWVLAGLALAVMAAVGAVLPPIARIQPNRFAPVAYLILCVPAAVGLGALLRRAASAGPLARRAPALLLIALALPGLLYAALETAREPLAGPHGHYGVPPPEVAGLGEKGSWALQWLRDQTDTTGRILFEDSRALVYDNNHAAGYLARESGREFIGGPYPYHHFAGFWDGFLFNRPIEQLSPAEFQEYMRLYNVRWILVHSDRSKRYLAGVPGVIPMETHEGLQGYRVEGPGSYFIEGSGSVVRRGPNRIELADLAGPSVVLKYHFIPGLKSDPPATIEAARMLDDPNSFIRILNPPPRMVLRLP